VTLTGFLSAQKIPLLLVAGSHLLLNKQGKSTGYEELFLLIVINFPLSFLLIKLESVKDVIFVGQLLITAYVYTSKNPAVQNGI